MTNDDNAISPMDKVCVEVERACELLIEAHNGTFENRAMAVYLTAMAQLAMMMAKSLKSIEDSINSLNKEIGHD